MFPSRRVCAALGLAATALLLAGCGDSGALRSAGPTATAVGPVQLWPELPPASTPAIDYGVANTETVKGIAPAEGDIHRVDPLDAVRAEVAAHPDAYAGPRAAYSRTREQLRDCGRQGAQGRQCPLLRAYYRDLTGDGKDDMVLGIRFPGNQLAVRVYTVEHGRLVQIMGASDSVISVELAGRDVIIRSPSAMPGYAFRTVWSWDPHQHAILATRDEILRASSPPTSGPVPPVLTRSIR
ncbi:MULTISPECIES: hypothetical protein [Streptomyces]|uniref:hypothetical protein n=1 Tax=Streptomyces TaxID=1883 RepID=UPI0007C63EFA|nr:hypothetical protein [Streptomyces nodosus]MBB4793820.1 hypothetical protein [Streptomyces nodosus]